jgi:pSer/pThr/pTyr-binding forkhead associated (FHA) protein
MKARIRINDGPLSGQTFEMVGERLVIGRGPECDIVVPSPLTMNRRNCMLLSDGFTLRIRDFGSKSGTFVNGRPIGTDEIILLEGDLITTGGTSFVIEIEGAARLASE